MAGIYIHIPFCKQACSYCDFHFSTNLKRKSELVKALTQEIKQRKDYLEGEKVDTIYFGGGTPSLLNQKELELIFDALNQNFQIASEVEITLEANPDDLDVKKLAELSNTAINRLSIGVQSFYEEDLKLMNRAHNAQEALASIRNAQEAGFEKLNIDLIFGSQTTTDKMWEGNLQHVFDLEIPHLSAYSLTIEEKTALSSKIAKGKIPSIDEEKNYRHYLMLIKLIAENGYEQYELSNFCKSNNYSKHNSAYWFGKKYLGIGPSAHSFDGHSRQWNVANNLKYIQALGNDQAFFEVEQLTEIDRYHEYLITGLRTMWGIDLEYVKTHFSAAIHDHLSKELSKGHRHIAIKDQSKISLRKEHLFQSDEVVRALMFS